MPGGRYLRNIIAYRSYNLRKRRNTGRLKKCLGEVNRELCKIGKKHEKNKHRG